jgi:hypothetical protein
MSLMKAVIEGSATLYEAFPKGFSALNDIGVYAFAVRRLDAEPTNGNRAGYQDSVIIARDSRLQCDLSNEDLNAYRRSEEQGRMVYLFTLDKYLKFALVLIDWRWEIGLTRRHSTQM